MNETITDILLLHLNGIALTASQEQQLQQWLEASGNNRNALHLLEDPAFLQQSIRQWDSYDASRQAGWERLSGQIFSKKPVPLLRRLRWVAAAAILLLAVAGTWLLLTYEKSSPTQQTSAGNDIAPGTSGAILTLSDGRKIVLDSMGNGQVALENGAAIQLQNNQLTYNPSAITNSPLPTFNSLTTPAGHQFTLVLPDGSRVWLNAGSSITYPAVFTGKERKVIVAGEVYMEVAPHRASPFIVDIDGKTTVQVLGTDFNINSYADDGYIRTTLINGSIKVLSATAPAAVILTPGQQAAVRAAVKEPIAVASAIDVNRVLAWKNGYFSFDNLNLRQVARQIERWYDVQVIFEGNTGNLSLTGEMDRGVSLSGIQRFLKQYGFTTTLNNRVLTITKN